MLLLKIKKLLKLKLTAAEAARLAEENAAVLDARALKSEIELIDNEIKAAVDSGLRRTRSLNYITSYTLEYYKSLGYIVNGTPCNNTLTDIRISW